MGSGGMGHALGADIKIREVWGIWNVPQVEISKVPTTLLNNIHPYYSLYEHEAEVFVESM